MQEQAMDIDQFAERVGVSPRTIFRLMEKGKIKPVRIGRRIIFREHHVTRVLDMFDPNKKKAQHG